MWEGGEEEIECHNRRHQWVCSEAIEDADEERDERRERDSRWLSECGGGLVEIRRQHCVEIVRRCGRIRRDGGDAGIE